MSTSPSFFATLRARVAATDSLLCVGLDPHVAELPEPTAAAAEAFCLRLIEATHAVAAAYKPNSAFFEAFGAEGFAALKRVIKAVPAGIPVLLDAKRGDISTTAAAYAVAAFDELESHAITLAPYMGRDSVDPFIKGHPERGCFVLCKTSNPTANDFQTLPLAAGSALFEHVAAKCAEWNTDDNIGLVVGATDVEVILPCYSHWWWWMCTDCRLVVDVFRRFVACARLRRSCGSWRQASARREATLRKP